MGIGFAATGGEAVVAVVGEGYPRPDFAEGWPVEAVGADNCELGLFGTLAAQEG